MSPVVGRTVWNTPAGPTAFAGLLTTTLDLDAIANRLWREIEGAVAERVKAYQVPVTLSTLLMGV